jgi:hypothetical protein
MITSHNPVFNRTTAHKNKAMASFIKISYLFSLVLAVQFITLASASKVIEYFSISELTTHFMGPNSGLPSGTWPPGSGFPSSIDFTIYHYFNTTLLNEGNEAVEIKTVPSPGDVHCGMNWITPNFDWVDCPHHAVGHDGFRFRFKQQDELTGANFTLEIVRGGML